MNILDKSIKIDKKTGMKYIEVIKMQNGSILAKDDFNKLKPNNYFWILDEFTCNGIINAYQIKDNNSLIEYSIYNGKMVGNIAIEDEPEEYFNVDNCVEINDNIIDFYNFDRNLSNLLSKIKSKFEVTKHVFDKTSFTLLERAIKAHEEKEITPVSEYKMVVI